STATYTITVVDNGPSDAQAVTTTDTLPAGLAPSDASPSQGSCAIAGQTVNCQVGTVPAGATGTLPRAASVSPAATGPIPTTAPAPANTPASTTTPVTAQADLRMVKAASAASVDAGAGLTFTLSVANNGPSDAAAIVATDPLPPGVSFDPTGSSPA